MKQVALLVIMTLLLSACVKGRPDAVSKERAESEGAPAAIDLFRDEASLRKAVESSPDSALAHFSYGRVLLAADKQREALPYLEKAVTLEPENAVYLFWQGVAYGENRKPVEERESYERALQRNRNFVQALVYLGNNYLNAKAFDSALESYERALVIDPANEQALYNRALICRQLQRTPEEIAAWHLYLEAYPFGELSRRAAEHLYALDDFSFRTHRLGHRLITLPAVSFKPFSTELNGSSQESLEWIGTLASSLAAGNLDILVYQKKNRDLARHRAVSIKKYLENRFPALETDKRIRLSWFDEPEERKVDNRTIRIDESVLFFLADPTSEPKAQSSKKGGRKK